VVGSSMSMSNCNHQLSIASTIENCSDLKQNEQDIFYACMDDAHFVSHATKEVKYADKTKQQFGSVFDGKTRKLGLKGVRLFHFKFEGPFR
jgi:hypothetical protein